MDQKNIKSKCSFKKLIVNLKVYLLRKSNWSFGGLFIHRFLVLVISEFLPGRVDQFFEYGLALPKILTWYCPKSVLKHIKNISDLEGRLADIVWIVLRTVKTQCIGLPGSTNFSAIRHVHWLPFPITWNRIKFHKFHDIFTHGEIVILLVNVSQEM